VRRAGVTTAGLLGGELTAEAEGGGATGSWLGRSRGGAGVGSTGEAEPGGCATATTGGLFDGSADGEAGPGARVGVVLELVHAEATSQNSERNLLRPISHL